MNKAALYHRANYVQRFDAQKALNKFASLFKWRSNGCDSVLDAGCGSGDVTLDLVLPILPANFSRLVGVDISNEMIDYARKTHIHPKVSFELMDLDKKLETQQFNGVEPFDHIVSFYCLMWIQNMELCIENFHKLLKPDGDMLLVFLVQHPLYDVYLRQSQDIRWTEYMKNIDQVMMIYQYSKSPRKHFENILRECGFTESYVRVENKTYVIDSTAELRDFLHAINPFIDRVPVKQKPQFLDDVVQQFAKLGCKINDFENNKGKYKFKFAYKLLVAYASK